MDNTFDFIGRFCPLSSLQGTIVEIGPARFVIAPEAMISYNIQPDHVLVWYKNEGEDSPRFAQISEFVSYQQVATALLPIDLPWGTAVPQDLLAVLESAPEEVLVAYATWAGGLPPGTLPKCPRDVGVAESPVGRTAALTGFRERPVAGAFFLQRPIAGAFHI